MDNETSLYEIFDEQGNINDEAVVQIVNERLLSFKSKMESLTTIEDLEDIKGKLLLFRGQSIEQAKQIREIKSAIDLLMIFDGLCVQVIDNEIAKGRPKHNS